MPKLTPKQSRFIDEYLTDLNGTRAAITAGYSKRTARTQAAQILAKRNIQEEITRRRTELAASQETVSPGEILQRLTAIIRGDIRAVCTWSNAGVVLNPSADLSDASGYAIQEVVSRPGKEGPHVRVKLCDRLAAIAQVIKILGMNRGLEPEEPVDWVNVGRMFADALKIVMPGKPRETLKPGENQKGTPAHFNGARSIEAGP